MAGTRGADAVAAQGVHDQNHLGVGGDTHLYCNIIVGGGVGVVRCRQRTQAVDKVHRGVVQFQGVGQLGRHHLLVAESEE